MKAVVSEKGQVTIPKKIRRRLGILPGTVMEFEARGERLVAHKTDESDDVIQSITGIIKLPMDVDDFLNQTRGKAR